MGWITRWRHRLRATLHRNRVESELDDELAYHLELEIANNVRSGLAPAEARRQAMLAFGGMEKHKEGVRDARTLGWAPGIALDLKLAWRMLMKSRGLTVVGGLGIAIAVAVGTLFFGVQKAVLYSNLPFEEGERVVRLEVRDAESSALERRILNELAFWREELRSVEDLSAWRPAPRNLIVPGGGAGQVEVAEMSPSGFRMARVPALVGRTLLEEDELAGAPAVAVLGYGVWQTRFGADPAVVGREIRLGNAPHTVVGVMPEGFAFPVNHELWVPLEVGARATAPRAGPEIRVFGRLAAGATMESAGAELSTLGQRMAGAFPDTHALLRPRVVAYTAMEEALYFGFRAVQTLTILLLLVVCVNVGILVHARTAARTREIALRTALGASRRRVVGQLFVEALVLALGSALAGLAIAWLVFRWAEGPLDAEGGLNFWMKLGLSPAAVLYALALAAASAVIVGVLPALKVTGSRLRSGLDQAGGAGKLRLGPRWTFQIVAQVAIATAILPMATFEAWNYFRYGFTRADFAAEEFLTAHLQMEVEGAEEEGGKAAEADRATRFDDRVAELEARLEADPSVAYVTFAKYPVGGTFPATVLVEDLPRAPDAPVRRGIRTNAVDLELFDALDVPVLEGRGFRPSDLAEGATPVVVNLAFVDEVLDGRNAIGRELRYTWRYGLSEAPRAVAEADTMRRYEIVGVVGDQLVAGTDPGETKAHVYHPATAGRLGAMNLVVRIRGREAEEFAPVLRELTAELDPTLQLHDIRTVEEGLRRETRVHRFVGAAIAIVTLSVVLLSAAGIHALMSFMIVRRRREIGIRSALGTRPGQLLAGIFSRAAGQIAIGLVVGLVAAKLLNYVAQTLTSAQAAIFFSAAAALMTVVGLLAALGPARRGLRIEPMEALRAE